MKIPVDLSRDVARAARKPRLNASGAIAAAGAKGQAAQAVGAVGSRLSRMVFDESMDERQKDVLADSANFRTHLTSLRTKAQHELKSIPMDDGVDFKAESDEIYARYTEEAGAWLQQAGNVRHAESMPDFQITLKEQEASAKNNIEEFGFAFERNRNVGRHKAEIESGIMHGSEESIVNGYRGRVSNGELTGKEAEVMAEKSIKAMNAKIDEQTMAEAELLLMDGDTKGYRAKVNETILPTQKDKDLTFRKNVSRRSYLSAVEVLDTMDDASLEEIQKFYDDPEAFASVRGMDQTLHRIPLRRQARNMLGRVNASQHKNARNVMTFASSGKIDEALSLIDSSEDLDNALGFPEKYRGAIRDMAVSAAKSFEDDVAYDALETVAKKDDDYKELNESLTAYHFNTDGFDLDKAVEDIQGLEAADPVKAKLLSRAFGLASSQFGKKQPIGAQEFSAWEVLPFVATYKELFGQKELPQGEIDTLERTYETFKHSVDTMGNWEGMTDSLQHAQKEIRKFYRKNESPSEAELNAFEVKILKPIHRRSIEHEKYRTE